VSRGGQDEPRAMIACKEFWRPHGVTTDDLDDW
jgi:hypothetical protein